MKQLIPGMAFIFPIRLKFFSQRFLLDCYPSCQSQRLSGLNSQIHCIHILHRRLWALGKFFFFLDNLYKVETQDLLSLAYFDGQNSHEDVAVHVTAMESSRSLHQLFYK